MENFHDSWHLMERRRFAILNYFYINHVDKCPNKFLQTSWWRRNSILSAFFFAHAYALGHWWIQLEHAFIRVARARTAFSFFEISSGFSIVKSSVTAAKSLRLARNEVQKSSRSTVNFHRNFIPPSGSLMFVHVNVTKFLVFNVVHMKIVHVKLSLVYLRRIFAVRNMAWKFFNLGSVKTINFLFTFRKFRKYLNTVRKWEIDLDMTVPTINGT